jgi:hypothetical protein
MGNAHELMPFLFHAQGRTFFGTDFVKVPAAIHTLVLIA